MSGTSSYIMPLAGCVFQVGIPVCAAYRREFLRYLPLNIYVLADALANLGMLFCIRRFGSNSQSYFYSYYAADLLLGICLYLVIVHLYQHALGNTKFKPYVRSGAAVLLAATCIFSYVCVRHSGRELTMHFVLAMEQNLNFVGVALTYLLWGAIVKRRETRARLVQLIFALGIYFSGIAAAYAVRTLFPQFDAHSIWQWAPPLISLWLPLAWFYAFLKIPDDARLLTRHVVVAHQ